MTNSRLSHYLSDFSGLGFKCDSPVPVRCLLPKGLDNLLVVGRCISSDHWANSLLRLMVNAFQLCVVGGTAVALSVKQSLSPRQIPYSMLKEHLTLAGVVF